MLNVRLLKPPLDSISGGSSFARPCVRTPSCWSRCPSACCSASWQPGPSTSCSAGTRSRSFSSTSCSGSSWTGCCCTSSRWETFRSGWGWVFLGRNLLGPFFSLVGQKRCESTVVIQSIKNKGRSCSPAVVKPLPLNREVVDLNPVELVIFFSFLSSLTCCRNKSLSVINQVPPWRCISMKMMWKLTKNN